MEREGLSVSGYFEFSARRLDPDLLSLSTCVVYSPNCLFHSGWTRAAVYFQILFFVLYFSMAMFARYKMGQTRCPDCDARIGGTRINSTLIYGKCPSCGYQGSK